MAKHKSKPQHEPLEEDAIREEVRELPAALRRRRSKESFAGAKGSDGFAFGCAGGAIVLIIFGVFGVTMKTIALAPRGGRGFIVTGQSAVWLGAVMTALGLVVLVATVRWIRARSQLEPPSAGHSPFDAGQKSSLPEPPKEKRIS